MNAELHDLWAGLSGITIVPERFDLGDGVTICQTYAHFMAPFLMAFSRPAAGKPHPAPWKTAKGGIAIDIGVEIFIPASCRLEQLDRLNTLWWLVALLRLKAAPNLFVPVISSEKFSAIPTIQQEPVLWPMEIHTHRLMPFSEHEKLVDAVDLDWLRLHWRDASALLSNDDFSTAFQAVDLSIWGSNPALALVGVWGALEQLFSASKLELNFRVSANIATYLEKPGRERYECFKQVKGLYDRRSKAAHGEAKNEIAPYLETYSIAKRILLKMVESKHVPTKKELEANLFGDDAGSASESTVVH